MNKKKRIISILGFILLLGIGLYSYYRLNNNQIPIIYSEKKLEIQKEMVEFRDKPITKEILNDPSNYISIDGVLNNRLMDDDGTYYYLNHNIDGKYDEIGIPIVDVRTNFETRKTIVYAHSTLAGNGPFQALQNYDRNKDFYDNHKYISIRYNGKDYKYEIFSVFLSLAEDDNSPELEYFYNTLYVDSEWEDIIHYYKDKSQYDTGVAVNKSDKILILQTCSMDPNYYEKYYRYNLLIFAKKI